jgi:hypothetical protein
METLTKYTEIMYIFAVVLATWIVLTYLIAKTSEKQRILITLLIGLALGLVWYLFVKPTPTIDRLVLSLFAAMGFYKAILGQILSMVNFNYNNGKGIDINPKEDPDNSKGTT